MAAKRLGCGMKRAACMPVEYLRGDWQKVEIATT